MATKCPECGGNVLKARNELVCVSCGFVLEDSPLVGYADKRDIDYYQRRLPTPAGCMPVAVKDKKVVEMYRAKYPLVSAEEQRQYHLGVELDRIGSLLSLCRPDRAEVLFHYNNLRKAGLTKNYPLPAVLGAVAGVVMQVRGRHVAPSVLADEIDAPKKTLKKLYYFYAKELGVPLLAGRMLRGQRTAEKRAEKERG